jgi:hypothetical protein
MSNADLHSHQMTAATGTRREFAANDVRMLIANSLRGLICRCPATQQQVNLQIFVDYATLTRIGSNLVRFRCPHCDVQHETQVAGMRQEALGQTSAREPRIASARDGRTIAGSVRTVPVQAYAPRSEPATRHTFGIPVCAENPVRLIW